MSSSDSVLHEKTKKAQIRLDRVLDHLLNLIQVHEINKGIHDPNRLLPSLKSQPALAAFRTLRTGFIQYEMIRLAALWDSDNTDEYESVPTVASLVEDQQVRSQLMDIEASFWARSVDEYADDRELEQLICDAENRFASERANQSDFQLGCALDKIKKIKESSQLAAVRKNRNKYFAHSLNQSRDEIRDGATPKLSLDDGRYVLDASVEVVQALLSSVGKNRST